MYLYLANVPRVMCTVVGLLLFFIMNTRHNNEIMQSKNKPGLCITIVDTITPV